MLHSVSRRYRVQEETVGSLLRVRLRDFSGVDRSGGMDEYGQVGAVLYQVKRFVLLGVLTNTKPVWD